MSLQRLWGRVTRLEVQRPPWVAADVLRRARGSAHLSVVLAPWGNDEKTSLIGEV